MHAFSMFMMTTDNENQAPPLGVQNDHLEVMTVEVR